jgi:hypothetical protein
MEDVISQRRKRESRFFDWVATAFFLLGLAFLSNALGPLTRQTSLAAAAASMALCVMVMLPHRLQAHRLWYFIAGLAIIISFTFLLKPAHFFSPIAAFFLAGAVAYWFGVIWFGKSNAKNTLPAILLLTSFLYALFLIIYRYFPFVWHIAQAGSQLISCVIAAMFGQRQLFGATALGLPILVLFITFLISVHLLSGSPGQTGQQRKKLKYGSFVHLSLTILALFVIHALWVVLQEPALELLGKFTSLSSAGMFGLLPNSLRALDYQVTVDSLLTAETLRNAHVLVVINLHRTLDGQEQQTIARFVENGGSLLVLGDHTGLGEMMPPLNDLLKGTGIQFNFDSGHYLKDGWNHAFELMPHVINSAIENENDVGVSVGASLAILPFKAKPVLTAKYGFSDWGNWLNKQNAYLGDRRYNPGELLSDIVLVAEGKWGKGKILVFGDTSSLQNGSMARNFTFVDGMLHWLAASEGDARQLPRTVIGAVLLLATAGLFLLTLRNHKNMAMVMIAFTGLASGFLFTGALAARANHQTVPRGNVAYIDMAHLERFEIYGDGGIWSLLYTLMRSDYLSFVHPRFSAPALRESKALFKIAPVKSLSEAKLRLVDEYLRAGGLVVWAVGYEEKEGSENFLRKYGLAIDNVPLGPVPKDQTDRGLYFHKAWPIVFTDSTAVEVLCSGWGYPVIVAKRIGKGQLVVIGDSEFLWARNLEGATRVHEENLRFVEALVKSSEQDFSNGTIKSEQPVVARK